MTNDPVRRFGFIKAARGEFPGRVGFSLHALAPELKNSVVDASRALNRVRREGQAGDEFRRVSASVVSLLKDRLIRFRVRVREDGSLKVSNRSVALAGAWEGSSVEVPPTQAEAHHGNPDDEAE